MSSIVAVNDPRRQSPQNAPPPVIRSVARISQIQMENAMFSSYLSTKEGEKTNEDGTRENLNSLQYKATDEPSRVYKKSKTIIFLINLLKQMALEDHAKRNPKSLSSEKVRVGSRSPLIFSNWEGKPDLNLRTKISSKLSIFQNELQSHFPKATRRKSESLKKVLDRKTKINAEKLGIIGSKRKQMGGRKNKTRKKKQLSLSDYRKILKFYKLPMPKNASNIRKKGDKIIAKKFCSCIKKVRAKFKKEGIAIGICTKSVINRKGYKRGKFKCKKRRSIKLYKGGSKYTKKNKRTRKKRGGRPLIKHPEFEDEYEGGNKSKKIKEIVKIFQQYPDIFPRGYFRFLSGTLEKHDRNGTLIYKNGVVLTYTKYKKRLNKYKKYKIQVGDVKLNQLVNKNQGNGKAKKIFLDFMKKHSNSNLLLDVLVDNKRAIRFYKKNGFKKIADTKFGEKMKGIVMIKYTKKNNRTRKK